MEKITSRTNWIKLLEVENLIEYFIQNNKSMYLPYHNYSHMMGFLYHALSDGMREFGVNKKYLQELAIAVIFHDFNHSGGKLKDSENIQIAIEALNKCPKEYFPKDFKDKENIYDLILATEYPYTISENSLNISQKIMRDCGVLWVVDSSSLIQNILGLGEELSYSGKIKDLILGHKEFVINSSKEFRTGYAMDIFDTMKESWETRLNQFINTIE